MLYFQMESRFNTEMEEHKQKLDREYESTRQNFVTELEKIQRKTIQDLEKRVSILNLVQINVHEEGKSSCSN